MTAATSDALKTYLTAIEQALNRMVMAIHQGQIQGFIPFDRQGQAVHFG